MIRTFCRTVLLFCMTAVLLCGTASANSLPPDYLVLVKLTNGPEEPYEMELLPQTGESDVFAYINPENIEHTAGGGGTHRFSGTVMPTKYCIRIVSQSGKTWTSDVLERRAVQDTVRINWATKRVSAPPVWLAVVLQTLSTLLPTLAIEGWLLRVFQFDWKQNRKTFLLVNLATQGALALFISMKIVQWGAYYAIVFFGAIELLPIELVIAFVEANQYGKRLKGQSKRWAFAYGLAANAASYVLGVAIVPRLWTYFVRVLWMAI